MANKKNKKKGISPVAVGIASTAAVAAGVAAVALSKKENRKKAGKVLKEMRTKGEVLTKNARERVQALNAKMNSGQSKSGSKKSSSKTGSKISTRSSSRASSARTARGKK